MSKLLLKKECHISSHFVQKRKVSRKYFTPKQLRYISQNQQKYYKDQVVYGFFNDADLDLLYFSKSPVWRSSRF